MLVMGLATAFMTACYMGRAYYLTFRGEYRGHAHPHESPKLITVPLMILAALSVVVGFLNWPFSAPLGSGFAHRFEHYVQPTFVFPPVEVAKFNPYVAVLSLAARRRRRRHRHRLLRQGPARSPGSPSGSRPPAGATSSSRTSSTWTASTTAWALLAPWPGRRRHVLDQHEDHRQGRRRRRRHRPRSPAGSSTASSTKRLVDTIVNGSGAASESSGQFLRRSQTGKVQQYASLLFGGVIAFVDRPAHHRPTLRRTPRSRENPPMDPQLSPELLQVQDIGSFFGTPLTYLIFVPLVGALIMMLIPKGNEVAHKVVALATSVRGPRHRRLHPPAVRAIRTGRGAETATTPAALAVPMCSSTGAAGVLSVEPKPGQPVDDSKVALAAIVAAQLATLEQCRFRQPPRNLPRRMRSSKSPSSTRRRPAQRLKKASERSAKKRENHAVAIR